ncbi:hypothetical protein MFIFM68171_05381 [Madurella fahalii]|uniref:Essential protein Yae1 N-terminal domain-containing protein n=1 Tax=Madurella fahalii TaxID=1157608 RepID=A0ABQ0GBQ2_9PEZI
MAITSTSTATDDPFDTLLTLEDDFYTQGYNQGHADGLVAGRTEGRQLGLERGFQKFVEAGRLQGRAIVWANRLRAKEAKQTSTGSPALNSSDSTGVQEGGGEIAGRSGVLGQGRSERVEVEGERDRMELPPLPHNPRLEKHVTALYALAETESLSTENTDEAVNDFDDRLRRAQGRAKIIERMVGEGQRGDGDSETHNPGVSGRGREVAEV